MVVTKEQLESKIKELIKHFPPRERRAWRDQLFAVLAGVKYIPPPPKGLNRAVPPFSQVMFRWGDQSYATGGKDIELERVLWVKDLLGKVDMLTFAMLDELVGYEERKRVVKLAIRRGTEAWHEWGASVDGVYWWEAKMGHPSDPVRPD